MLDETEIKTEDDVKIEEQDKEENVEQNLPQFSYTLDLSFLNRPKDENPCGSNSVKHASKSTLKFVKLKSDNSIETNCETPWTLAKKIPRSLERILSYSGLEVSGRLGIETKFCSSKTNEGLSRFRVENENAVDGTYSNFVNNRNGCFNSTINPKVHQEETSRLSKNRVPHELSDTGINLDLDGLTCADEVSENGLVINEKSAVLEKKRKKFAKHLKKNELNRDKIKQKVEELIIQNLNSDSSDLSIDYVKHKKKIKKNRDKENILIEGLKEKPNLNTENEDLFSRVEDNENRRKYKKELFSEQEERSKYESYIDGTQNNTKFSDQNIEFHRSKSKKKKKDNCNEKKLEKSEIDENITSKNDKLIKDIQELSEYSKTYQQGPVSNAEIDLNIDLSDKDCHNVTVESTKTKIRKLEKHKAVIGLDPNDEMNNIGTENIVEHKKEPTIPVQPADFRNLQEVRDLLHEDTYFKPKKKMKLSENQVLDSDYPILEYLHNENREESNCIKKKKKRKSKHIHVEDEVRATTENPNQNFELEFQRNDEYIDDNLDCVSIDHSENFILNQEFNDIQLRKKRGKEKLINKKEEQDSNSIHTNSKPIDSETSEKKSKGKHNSENQEGIEFEEYIGPCKQKVRKNEEADLSKIEHNSVSTSSIVGYNGNEDHMKWKKKINKVKDNKNHIDKNTHAVEKKGHFDYIESEVNINDSNDITVQKKKKFKKDQASEKLENQIQTYLRNEDRIERKDTKKVSEKFGIHLDKRITDLLSANIDTLFENSDYVQNENSMPRKDEKLSSRSSNAEPIIDLTENGRNKKKKNKDLKKEEIVLEEVGKDLENTNLTEKKSVLISSEEESSIDFTPNSKKKRKKHKNKDLEQRSISKEADVDVHAITNFDDTIPLKKKSISLSQTEELFEFVKKDKLRNKDKLNNREKYNWPEKNSISTNVGEEPLIEFTHKIKKKHKENLTSIVDNDLATYSHEEGNKFDVGNLTFHDEKVKHSKRKSRDTNIQTAEFDPSNKKKEKIELRGRNKKNEDEKIFHLSSDIDDESFERKKLKKKKQKKQIDLYILSDNERESEYKKHNASVCDDECDSILTVDSKTDYNRYRFDLNPRSPDSVSISTECINSNNDSSSNKLQRTKKEADKLRILKDNTEIFIPNNSIPVTEIDVNNSDEDSDLEVKEELSKYEKQQLLDYTFNALVNLKPKQSNQENEVKKEDSPKKKKRKYRNLELRKCDNDIIQNEIQMECNSVSIKMKNGQHQKELIDLTNIDNIPRKRKNKEPNNKENPINISKITNTDKDKNIESDADIFSGIFTKKECNSSETSNASMNKNVTMKKIVGDKTDESMNSQTTDQQNCDYQSAMDDSNESSKLFAPKIDHSNNEGMISNFLDRSKTRCEEVLRNNDLNNSFSFSDILSQSHKNRLSQKFNEIVVGSTMKNSSSDTSGILLEGVDAQSFSKNDVIPTAKSISTCGPIIEKKSSDTSSKILDSENTESSPNSQLESQTKSSHTDVSLKSQRKRKLHDATNDRSLSKSYGRQRTLDSFITRSKRSEEKKKKEKVIELLEQSKSINEIEEELDIPQIDEEREKVSGLHIEVPWSMPLIHKIAHNVSFAPSPEQRRALAEAGINLKKGKYTKEEDEQIKENWKEFCKYHDWDENNYHPFMKGTRRSKKGVLGRFQFQKFTQFMARGFEDRLMYNIYLRFRRLFSDVENGRFTPEDDKIIREYVESRRSENPFADLATILKRSRNAILKRYQLIRPRKMSEGETILWNKPLTEEFLVNIIEKTYSTNLSDLKDRKISTQEWKKISKNMNISIEKLKRAWIYVLYPRFFTPNYVGVIQGVKRKLIDLLYEKYTDFREINWYEVAKEFDDGFTHAKLCKLLKDMVAVRVPPNRRNDLHRALKYLRKHFDEGNRKAPDKFKFVEDILRETKNGTVMPKIPKKESKEQEEPREEECDTMKEIDNQFSDCSWD